MICFKELLFTGSAICSVCTLSCLVLEVKRTVPLPLLFNQPNFFGLVHLYLFLCCSNQLSFCALLLYTMFYRLADRLLLLKFYDKKMVKLPGCSSIGASLCSKPTKKNIPNENPQKMSFIANIKWLFIMQFFLAPIFSAKIYESDTVPILTSFNKLKHFQII